MNIFLLHPEADIAASMACDKHVVKMTLEYAQLLSTAMHVRNKELGIDAIDILKPTHINHPSAIWTRSGYYQYEHVLDMFLESLRQYTLRYGKTHKYQILQDVLLQGLSLFEEESVHTPPPPFVGSTDQVGDPEKWMDVVLNYRMYYVIDKQYFARWKLGNVPEWYTVGVGVYNSYPDNVGKLFRAVSVGL